MKKLALILCAVLLFSMVACADDNKENVGDTGTKNTGTNGTGANGTGAKSENELTGTAKGYGGDVTVTVTVDGDDILSVEAVGEKETEGVGSKAIEELPVKIEEADSTEVDAVAGATVTSNAIKEAVDKALESK